MFVITVWSLPATLKVLSFASIAGIAIVEAISGEIELEAMSREMRHASRVTEKNDRQDLYNLQFVYSEMIIAMLCVL